MCLTRPPPSPYRTEDISITREKAIHVVEQGQKSENLLDFDADDDVPDALAAFGAPAGTGAAASINPLAGMAAPPQGSSQRNALEDMLDLFSSQSMSAPATQPTQQKAQAQATPAPSGGGDLLDFL